MGSIYYSTFDGITNPIVPLAQGCTAKTALTGKSGAFYNESTGAGAALKASCFTIPLIAQGTQGVPNGDVYETGFTSGQRNIFRQSYQKRTDASIVKTMTIHDQYSLRYTFDVYNVTNTSSFDIPSDNVSQNESYNNAPTYPLIRTRCIRPRLEGSGLPSTRLGLRGRSRCRFGCCFRKG